MLQPKQKFNLLGDLIMMETQISSLKPQLQGIRSFVMKGDKEKEDKNAYVDPHYRMKLWNNWKERNKNGIEGISKINSDLVMGHLIDMERGVNVSKMSKPGSRSVSRLHPLAFNLKKLAWWFEDLYKKDMVDLTEDEVLDFFQQLKEGEITKLDGDPYAPKTINCFIENFISFWHWFMRLESRKRKKELMEKGKTERKEIFDIVEFLTGLELENKFVYFTYEEMIRGIQSLDEDHQMLCEFLFDSIVRSPTEVANIYVNDLTFDKDGTVYAYVRQKVSKTYARKFDLPLCGLKLKEYIKKHELRPTDRLFGWYDPQYFNPRLQKAFVAEFGDIMTDGDKSMSEITGYSFRHAGTCHWIDQNVNPYDLMKRGGWKTLSRINYYTKFLGKNAKLRTYPETINKANSNHEDVKAILLEIKKENAELRKEIQVIKTPKPMEVAQNV